MDIATAFTFVFDDPQWVKKLAIGGIITFIGIVLSPVLVGIAILFLIGGYGIEVLKNVRDDLEEPLPEWNNFGHLLKNGFFVFLITTIYFIPVYLALCLGIMAMFAPYFTAGLNSELTGGTVIVTTFCLYCILPLFSLIASFFLPAALIMYAQNDSFGAAFQFGRMYNLISNNIGDYIIAVLLSLVAQMIGSFGFILCFVGIFFTTFWSILVSVHLYGQLAKKAN